jgi:hypothetical protein
MGPDMTLRIERICDRGGTRICLAGELRSAHLDEVGAEIGRVAGPVTLDLEEVDIVDLDGIRWLNRCQTQGVKVVNCCSYIRKWMGLEKSDNRGAEL